jgi:hypothetical protein
MATGIVVVPLCAACGSPSARVELIAPGKLPAEWGQWSQEEKDSFRRYPDPARWWLPFDGVAAGNGGGDAVSADHAARIAEAFGLPHSYEHVHAAGFYDDAGFCTAVCRTAAGTGG